MNQWVRFGIWGLLGGLAALSWGVLFAGGPVWDSLMHPAHRRVLYILLCSLALLYGSAWFVIGFFDGVKIFASSSLVAFFATLGRGFLISFAAIDCENYCFGYLNDVLGLGCGASDEGCATEFYLMVFFVAFIFLIILAFLGKRKITPAPNLNN